MLAVLPIIALLCAPAIWMVMGRPRFLKDQALNGTQKKVSIIIPARNEEISIGALLESLASQSFTPHEIIVANDNSEDATEEIARSYSATVLQVPDLPDGWKGKPWACHNAAQNATGDYLLFLDADTRLAPQAVAKLLAVSDKLTGAISVSPYHTVIDTYEQLSAFFNVLMIAGSNAFSGSHQSSALFGQCLLISKQDYLTVGGHAAVKNETLENFSLSKKLREHAIACHCLLGRGLISMRMFPEGFAQLRDSWKKGFTSGAANTAARALIYSSIWISGAMFSIVSLLLLPFMQTLDIGLTIICYLVYVAQCIWLFGMAGSFSWLNALFYPLSLCFYQYLFFTALAEKRSGKTTQWKGREIS